MRRHIFFKLPKWSPAIKPSLLWVRCPGWMGHRCGKPHLEYLGPKDHDEGAAELKFLRHELEVAATIAGTRSEPPRSRRVSGRPPSIATRK
jgi:hypothetical protein